MGTRPPVRRPRLENSPLLAAKGYGWPPDAQRARGSRTDAARPGGLPVPGRQSPDAARFLYDEDHVRRSRAIPEPVQGTLFGKGAVHTLDGEAHRTRKAMFVTLLMDDDRIAALVDAATAAWDAAVPGWVRRGEVVLFDEAADVITRAVCDWAGVPLTDDEVPSVARDLTAMVDGFATAGPRPWRARGAGGRREAWLARLVEEVRSGTATVPAGSVVDVVARHRDGGGERLDPRTAAVEVLNVVRPPVAISWFLAFSGHALARWPQHRERLASGEPAFAEAWAHEVRRFYPFAPFIGGRAPREVEWDGQRVPQHSMVLLDLYGQDHDPE